MSTLTSRARTLRRVRRLRPTITWGSARWQSGLAAAIAAVIFWPQSSVDPVAGPDASWQARLALARMHDLAWGPEFVYAYEPLALQTHPLLLALVSSLLATIGQLIVVVALFLGMPKALRQRHARWHHCVARSPQLASSSSSSLVTIGGFPAWSTPSRPYLHHSHRQPCPCYSRDPSAGWL